MQEKKKSSDYSSLTRKAQKTDMQKVLSMEEILLGQHPSHTSKILFTK